MGRLGKLFSIAGFSLLVFLPCVRAGDDDHYHVQNFQPPQETYKQNVQVDQPKIEQNNLVTWFKDFMQGGMKGDVIEHPNITNLIGQLAVAFTPAGIAGAIRDFSIDSFRSAESGFKEHKAEMAFAAAGCIPVFLEAKKFQSIYVAEKEAVEAERSLKVAGYLSEDSKWARETLPALKPTYAAEFEEVTQRTFKAGDKVYRSPASAAESGFEPGRWFGTRKSAYQESSDRMYQLEKFDNPNETFRTYEFKKDVTVYYGKVKDGTAWQAFIPEDIPTNEVLKWTGIETKLKR